MTSQEKGDMRNKPLIDGRDFKSLRDEAIEIIKQKCPSWSDLTASDPGIVLLEAFAYLTDVMLYRLNQLPRNVYIEILQLFGVQRIPASTSEVEVEFSITEALENSLVIPKHTKVGVEGREDLQFITLNDAEIIPGDLKTEVRVYNCRYIDGEIVGYGDSKSGNRYQLKHCPVISSSQEPLKIIVGVETEENSSNNTFIRNGYTYEIWNEIEDISFTDITKREFMIDYANGEIMFPALGSSDQLNPIGIPAKGKKICISYYSGGGDSGNVAPYTINKIISHFDYGESLSVINNFASRGGADAEELTDTMLRAPGEINAQNRAITASDYEVLATRINGIHRAKALTQKSIYSYGREGTVTLFISPEQNMDDNNQVEYDLKRKHVYNTIMERSILGTNCDVKWAKTKPVGIKTYLQSLPGFNEDDVRERVHKALNEEINPYCKGFGESILLADIYRTIMSCNGVAHINSVGFITDENPDENVVDIKSDCFMDNMWYACQDNDIYTSQNRGDSWEKLLTVDDHLVYKLTPDSYNPGNFAFISRFDKDSTDSTIYVSSNCGVDIITYKYNFHVTDISWVKFDHKTWLYITSHSGVFRLDLESGETIEVVMGDSSTSGYYSITSFPPEKETEYIVLLSRLGNGVYVSNCDDNFESFKEIGFRGKDIRSITIEPVDNRAYMWFGQAAIADEEGYGCYRVELNRVISSNLIKQYSTGWIGGSCRGLAIEGNTLWAGTHRAGLLSLNLQDIESGWGHSTIHTNLPKRDTERVFVPINEVSSNRLSNTLMVATENGLYRKDGNRFFRCSDRYKTKYISAPVNYVFTSLKHEIKVSGSHE